MAFHDQPLNLLISFLAWATADAYIAGLKLLLSEKYLVPDDVIRSVVLDLGEAQMEQKYNYNLFTTYNAWYREVRRFGTEVPSSNNDKYVFTR